MRDVIIGLESDFANNNYFGTNVWTEEKYRVLSGKIPVILSAPHAVNQIRGEDVRNAEQFTGALTRYLSTSTGSYGIFQMFTHADPNDDKDHYYKNAILNLVNAHDIKLLIDIHSSSFKDDCDIDIVTNKRQTLCGQDFLINELYELANKHNVLIGENNVPNKECENEIISNTAMICGIPSIRIVLNNKKIDIVNNEKSFEKICGLLEEFINGIMNNNVK